MSSSAVHQNENYAKMHWTNFNRLISVHVCDSILSHSDCNVHEQLEKCEIKILKIETMHMYRDLHCTQHTTHTRISIDWFIFTWMCTSPAVRPIASRQFIYKYTTREQRLKSVYSKTILKYYLYLVKWHVMKVEIYDHSLLSFFFFAAHFVVMSRWTVCVQLFCF